MKEIKLKRMVLSNWKSLNADVTFNDETTTISGRNGVGKSTIMHGFYWLLSGYTNALSPKNHELFDNRIELTHETPTASVKAWISIDGVEYTLEKQAKAKFTRKRGTNEYIKDSADSYKILIDEIETSTTDYNSWIEHNICAIDNLVYSIDGSFFSTLADDDKRKARKVLETIVGEIKESDFVGDYSLLADDFAKGYTIEQIEERTKNLMKPLRERMVEIPAIVKDKEKMLSEYRQIDYADIERQIEEKKKTIEDIDNAILGKADSIKPILGQRDNIFEIINSKTLKLNECRNTYLSKQNAVRNEIKRNIDDINANNALIQSRNLARKSMYDRNCEEIERAKKELASLSEYREVLLKRKDDIKAKVFNGDTCAVCGQELPLTMIEEAKAKFNNQKQEDLDYIVAQGKQTKTKIDMCQSRIDALQILVDKGVEFEVEQSAVSLKAKLSEFDEKAERFEDTKEYADLTKEIQELKATLPEIPTNDNEALTNTKKTLIDALGTLYSLHGRKTKVSELKDEIDALKYELKHIGTNIATLEGKLAKCGEYKEEKANIISLRVNDKLNDCKIQMWERQKNGDLVGSCIITDDEGVKFSTLNHSKRLKVQIELQRLFNKHNNVILPIWVDESDCFDSYSLPKINGTQMIYMHASDDTTIQVV